MLLVLWACTASVHAKGDDPLYKATYKGTLSGWRIEMHRTLVQTGPQEYALISEAKNLLASIREQSQFAIKDGQLVPGSYVYDRRVFGRQVTERIDFDWARQTAVYNRSDRPQNRTQHALTDGLLDPALYQLALQADLANSSPQTHYRFIKRRRVEDYAFVLQPGETLRWNRQDYQALLVMRQDTDQDKITRVWILPERDYQIARIQHIDEEGDTYELQLSELHSDPQRLAAFFQTLAAPPADTESAVPVQKPAVPVRKTAIDAQND